MAHLSAYTLAPLELTSHPWLKVSVQSEAEFFTSLTKNRCQNKKPLCSLPFKAVIDSYLTRFGFFT